MRSSRHALAPILVLGVLSSACGAARDRPEPPSGAVRLGEAGLATPGLSAGTAAPPPVDPIPGGAAGLVTPPAGARASPAGPAAEATGEAAGSMVMTRAHCEALGRKFAELTLSQGGMLGEVDEAGKREAAGVGRTFAERCAREMVGQTVEAREYACMMRARTPDGLLDCKR